MIKGIDVSKHQGVIDWDKVKAAGIDFVIMRAGCGTGKDVQFERNYLECKKRGIPVGAYYYSYATNESDALTEAKLFENILYGKQFDLPVFLDIETEKGLKAGQKVADVFCSYLESKGYYVGIYTSRSHFQTFLPNITARWAGWVADWTGSCKFNQPWLIWQSSEKGRVNGISGNVDTDEWCSEQSFMNTQKVIHDRCLNGYKPVESAKAVTVEQKNDRVQVYINGKCVYDSAVS